MSKFAWSRKGITAQGLQAMLSRWQKHVSQEDLKGVQKILDALGIREYKAVSPFPDWRLCYLDMGMEEECAF